MSRVIFALVALCGSVAYGYEPGYIPGVPYTPGSVTAYPGPGAQVVNQQVVAPPMVPIQPSTVPAGLPVQEWRDGLREEFTHKDVHEIRPIQSWENYPGYAGYYNNQQVQQVYQPQQQWYQPSYYPQQYSQQPYYYQPQQSYYQQPAYYQPQQCQQYYYQPRCCPCPQYYYPQQNCLQRWLGL